MSKFPNQADGKASDRGAADGVSDSGTHGRSAGGESGGGAYPNPHTGGDSSDSVEGAAGDGSVKYFGKGQAGDDHDGSGTPNSPAGS